MCYVVRTSWCCPAAAGRTCSGSPSPLHCRIRQEQRGKRPAAVASAGKITANTSDFTQGWRWSQIYKHDSWWNSPNFLFSDTAKTYHVFWRRDEFNGGILDFWSFVWLPVRSADWVVHKLLWNCTDIYNTQWGNNIEQCSMYFVFNSILIQWVQNKQTGPSSPHLQTKPIPLLRCKNNTLSASNFGLVPGFCNFIFHTVRDAAMTHLF